MEDDDDDDDDEGMEVRLGINPEAGLWSESASAGPSGRHARARANNIPT
jgi:hypothetical protein